MENNTLKAKCPLQYAMLVLGDKWSLLLIRDIMFHGVCSYSEFLANERIASNILQSKLSRLIEDGLLHKRGSVSSKKKVLYTLTDDAIELLPVILELMAWGNRNVPNEEVMQLIVSYRKNPNEVLQRLKNKIISGREVTIEQMVD